MDKILCQPSFKEAFYLGQERPLPEIKYNSLFKGTENVCGEFNLEVVSVEATAPRLGLLGPGDDTLLGSGLQQNILSHFQNSYITN